MLKMANERRGGLFLLLQDHNDRLGLVLQLGNVASDPGCHFGMAELGLRGGLEIVNQPLIASIGTVLLLQISSVTLTTGNSVPSC